VNQTSARLEGGLEQPDAVIEAFQNARLQDMLALCARGHPYYRQRWSEAGVDPHAIRTVGDI
jgi:phenylacetate-coenzyme A ligase PaaK-like adenylate-forming protein